MRERYTSARERLCLATLAGGAADACQRIADLPLPELRLRPGTGVPAAAEAGGRVD
jgi:hypothetical protein